jgi:hypothetical protein
MVEDFWGLPKGKLGTHHAAITKTAYDQTAHAGLVRMCSAVAGHQQKTSNC